MAITFVAAGTLANADTANITPGLPVGWAVDDIFVMLCGASDNVVLGTPSGWTKKIELNNTVTERLTAYWRRAVAGDTAPTVTYSGTTEIAGRIAAFRGCVTSGDPFDAFSSKANANSTTVTTTAITPLNANDMILFLGNMSNQAASSTFSAYSGTNPVFAEAFQDHAGPAGSADWVNQAMAYGIKTDTTTTGARTATLSVGGENIGCLLSLTPAASGSVAVIPIREPKRVGPTARSFMMFQRLPVIPAAVVDVTIALTGVAATSAVGSLGVQINVPIVGVSSTTAGGSVGVQHDNALTGASSTTAVGSLTPSTTVLITGVAATLSVGSLAPSTTLILSGVAVTGSVGTMAPSTTVALLGVSATGQVGSVVASGGDVTPTNASEVIFLLPSGKLAKRITDKIYQELD